MSCEARASDADEWILPVYKIPAQPSRLRLQVWHRLQSMGALCLQDAACVLPARPDLVENMHDVAGAIEEMGGTCHLFEATALLPDSVERVGQEFRRLADSRLDEISERLDGLHTSLETAKGPRALERLEEQLKRERIAYLRQRRLAYCGTARATDVENRLDTLRRALDDFDLNPENCSS